MRNLRNADDDPAVLWTGPYGLPLNRRLDWFRWLVGGSVTGGTWNVGDGRVGHRDVATAPDVISTTTTTGRLLWWVDWSTTYAETAENRLADQDDVLLSAVVFVVEDAGDRDFYCCHGRGGSFTGVCRANMGSGGSKPSVGVWGREGDPGLGCQSGQSIAGGPIAGKRVVFPGALFLLLLGIPKGYGVCLLRPAISGTCLEAS